MTARYGRWNSFLTTICDPRMERGGAAVGRLREEQMQCHISNNGVTVGRDLSATATTRLYLTKTTISNDVYLGILQ